MRKRRGTIGVTIEELGHDSCLDVDVDYEATPEEPMIRYDRDGGGYPGCPAQAELIGVTVTDWYVDGETRPRTDSEWWGLLDRLAFERIENDWHYHEERCLEHASEAEEQ